MSVVIVGAGASGLTAGYELYWANRTDFTILEATMNIGGRLRDLNKFASFPIPLGGEWLHVEPDVLNSIVDDPELDLTKLVETKPWMPLWSTYNKKTKKWSKQKNYINTDRVFVNSSWHQFFDEYIANWFVDDNIEFDCVVNDINYSKDPIKVSCQDGRSFTADKVIVTATPQVLNAGMINFIPPLPQSHQKALGKMVSPNGFKAFLKFKKNFYNRDTFGFVGDDVTKFPANPGDRTFYDATLRQKKSNDNILGVFCRGFRADSYMKLTDKKIIKRLLRELDQMFKGQASKFFVSGHVQNWSKEPYVLGTYSEYPRDKIAPMKVLKKPIRGKIYFAGEHLPKHKWRWGFAHGAALSGQTVAWEVLDSM